MALIRLSRSVLLAYQIPFKQFTMELHPNFCEQKHYVSVLLTRLACWSDKTIPRAGEQAATNTERDFFYD
jgi:hypothetical protein